MAKRQREQKKARSATKRGTRKGGIRKRVAKKATRKASLVATSSGFDCGSYPGDTAIRKWAANSPYSFVGFYFDAPCHTTATFKTWSGRFPVIKDAGLGLAIVYVGFQQDGCGRAKLSRDNGLAHGQDAVTKFAAEGFPDGAIVFLDVEHYNGALSAPMEAYIRGWLSAVLDSGTVTPGIYCPASKSKPIHLAAEKEYAAHGLPGGAPAFWIVKVDPLFDRTSSKPTDSGVSFAALWQGKLDTTETHGGISINVDQNVADSSDPSGALGARLTASPAQIHAEDLRQVRAHARRVEPVE
jgi:Rv2525c-like, glycoside hydrolase-like domain